MLAKFAEDDRIELMNAQKRRMKVCLSFSPNSTQIEPNLTHFKQLEHKRAAENLLAARRERRSIEIAQKQAERDAEQKEAELKAKLVEEERQKLIAKHAQVGLQIRTWFPPSHWPIEYDWLRRKL